MRLAIKSLFLGIIAAFGALVLELVFFNLNFVFSQKEMEAGYFQNITFLLMLVVGIEEIFKYLVIQRTLGALTSKKEMFFSSVLIGIGFSLLEIVFIFWEQNSFRDFAVWNALSLPAIHAAAAGTMGYFIAEAGKTSLPLAIKIVFLASALHFIFNALVIYEVASAVTYFYLFLLLFSLALMARQAKKAGN